ncbi:MAG: lysylphosphatidylglycerol synthase transmembrane domain-containing protein [Bacteroidota bacterium]
MSPRLKTVLTFGGSLVLGGGLLFVALRGVDFSAVGEALRTADYAWLVPLLAVSLLSHYARAWRWRLLLDVLPDEPDTSSDSTLTDLAKPRASTLQAFYATMIGYMVNQAAPRLGEPARAANLAAVTRHRFSSVFGTVVVERLVDVVVLLAALASVLVLFWSRLGALLGEFAGGARVVIEGLRAQSGVLLALGGLSLVVVLGAVWWWRARRRAGTGGKIQAMLLGFGEGLRSLVRVRNKIGLVWSTAAIWICYAVMTYIPLQMIGIASTYGLTLLDAWAMVALGAVGMALPSPGGTGSYHYAIIVTMTLLLGVPETPAATYALLTHAVQLVFLVVVGALCLLAQGASIAPPSEADARATPEGTLPQRVTAKPE